MDGMGAEGRPLCQDFAPGTLALAGTASAWTAGAQAPVPWSAMGLPTVASMLVVSGRSSTARCRWPRFHPLEERSCPVRRHPLTMVEHTGRLALAVARLHMRGGPHAPAFETQSVSPGLGPGVQPQERDKATDAEVALGLSDIGGLPDRLPSYQGASRFPAPGDPLPSLHDAPGRPVCRGASRTDDSVPGGPAVVGPGPGGPAVDGVLHPPGAAAGGDAPTARAPQGRVAPVPRDPALPPGRPDMLKGSPADRGRSCLRSAPPSRWSPRRWVPASSSPPPAHRRHGLGDDRPALRRPGRSRGGKR